MILLLGALYTIHMKKRLVQNFITNTQKQSQETETRTKCRVSYH